MLRVVLEQSLGFVATVTPDGRPNLSPKGTTTVWDEHHLMFADIASPGTVENLASNLQRRGDGADRLRALAPPSHRTA
jgi:predicted pyridoxine 5'-phosphate oxidase superfamily flavin-nucleotide-binding protein